MARVDASILQAALIGYQHRLAELNGNISEIQKKLGGRGNIVAVSITADGSRPRRTMSAAGRRRIAAAQKARWQKFHAEHRKPAKRAAAKRPMSPERKVALVANLAKARAARAAKKAKAATT
jgi:hypothetical protein